MLSEPTTLYRGKNKLLGTIVMHDGVNEQDMMLKTIPDAKNGDWFFVPCLDIPVTGNIEEYRSKTLGPWESHPAAMSATKKIIHWQKCETQPKWHIASWSQKELRERQLR